MQIPRDIVLGGTRVMATQPEALLTADEYARLPEALGFKDELIEGERVLAPMPELHHTVVVKNLEQILERQVQDAMVLRESGWHFHSADGKENVLGPDLMVVPMEDYERCVRNGGWFQGQPLLVVEVISPSERKGRRLQKVGLYLEAGAGAVVEVDLRKRLLVIHKPDIEAAEVVRSGRVEWPFEADVAEIFSHLP